ncbi:hypothetical protein GCM10017559_30610 [Streptosporangium longisporum]|uniref:Uncharacterized protein n=1 Tax=Streptosporangium longisporum TaxID=46187 RepID=A0ABN3XZ22_9ACTN
MGDPLPATAQMRLDPGPDPVPVRQIPAPPLPLAQHFHTGIVGSPGRRAVNGVRPVTGPPSPGRAWERGKPRPDVPAWAF